MDCPLQSRDQTPGSSFLNRVFFPRTLRRVAVLQAGHVAPYGTCLTSSYAQCSVALETPNSLGWIAEKADATDCTEAVVADIAGGKNATAHTAVHLLSEPPMFMVKTEAKTTVSRR